MRTGIKESLLSRFIEYVEETVLKFAEYTQFLKEKGIVVSSLESIYKVILFMGSRGKR